MVTPAGNWAWATSQRLPSLSWSAGSLSCEVACFPALPGGGGLGPSDPTESLSQGLTRAWRSQQGQNRGQPHLHLPSAQHCPWVSRPPIHNPTCRGCPLTPHCECHLKAQENLTLLKEDRLPQRSLHVLGAPPPTGAPPQV